MTPVKSPKKRVHPANDGVGSLMNRTRGLNSFWSRKP